MPTQRLSMRRIREVLRLRHQGLTERVIAGVIGASNGVVHGYLRRARLAGLTWPLPDAMDDEGLELLLFPAPTAASQSDRRPVPDWIYVEKELRRRSVTRLLLWEEYRAANPDGFGYTWFCTTFEAWKKRARPTMRQTHMGGEKVFVDFAGDPIDIFDPITGEAHAMKLFVAAMGASNYTYAEACPSENLSDWIALHTNLFRFLGGVPKFVVCDNLKAAVTNPDRYDPGLNRTYAEMASHYGTAILAARPRRPKDKAKVEIDGHWYSTPYRLIRELVDVRIADKTVEIFHKGQRIASHARAPNRRGHTTIADHMPSAHRRYGMWTPGGLIAAGERIGPSTAAFFQAVIAARPHPEQGFRTCLGILSLARSYDNARVDAACRRGILIKARSVASIRSILKNGLDRAFLDETLDQQPLRHGNIRGQGYFH